MVKFTVEFDPQLSSFRVHKKLNGSLSEVLCTCPNETAAKLICDALNRDPAATLAPVKAASAKWSTIDSVPKGVPVIMFYPEVNDTDAWITTATAYEDYLPQADNYPSHWMPLPAAPAEKAVA